MFLCEVGRDPLKEFKTERIPGAAYFDIDGVADQATGLPHMLPPAHVFAAVAAALGVTPETPVIVYDGMGMFSAPRVWWTFKVFGHSKCVPHLPMKTMDLQLSCCNQNILHTLSRLNSNSGADG